MDFQEILAQAAHNAKASKKVLGESDRAKTEREIRDREQFSFKLAKEREEKRRKAECRPEPKQKAFVIPKKNNANSGVDVSAFIQKQKAAQIEKIKKQKKEVDERIKKRLEANNGRANKKIASQFGKSTIELQTKYAHNSHRELELHRREQKEMEAIEKKAEQLKAGIDRAVAHRQHLQAKYGSTAAKPAGTRIGNVKADGFASLSSKHDEKFDTHSSAPTAKRKALPPPTSKLDFQQLMEQAKINGDAEKAAARAKALMEKRYDLVDKIDKTSGGSSSASHSKASSFSSKLDPPKRDAPKASATSAAMFRKPTGVKPKAPPAQVAKRSSPPLEAKSNSNPSMYQKKEQRYLPGDIRYKGPPPGVSKAGTSSSKSEERPKPKVDPYKAAMSKLQGKPIPVSKPEFTDFGRREQSRSRPQDFRQARYDRDYRRTETDRRKEDGRDRPGSSYSHFQHHRDQGHIRGYDDEDDYDDDEYDDDLADFIDDTEVDDLQRADFEESLKAVNRNYNKDVWMKRERSIDERKMTARFRDIEAEERRSAKLALMEDVIEAQKGSHGI